MKEFWRSQSVGILALCVLIAIFAMAGSWRLIMSPTPPIVFKDAPLPATATASPIPQDTPPDSPRTDTPGPTPAPEVVVHITGAVKKPGVYHLPAGARGEEALAAAGGAKPNANLDALNLAAKVEDGAQLFFPTRKEQPKGLAERAYEADSMPVVTVQTRPETSRAAARPAAQQASRTRSGKLTLPGQGFVNINTADAETLKKLPNVGPAMAERILAFRQEMGKFQTPEDLLQVSGIGPKRLEQMRPFIKVK